MGNEDRCLDYDNRHRWSQKEQKDFDDDGYQCACLEMSLKSGLGRLEGLKELRVLGVTGMGVCIGSEETRWMKENWPWFLR